MARAVAVTMTTGTVACALAGHTLTLVAHTFTIETACSPTHITLALAMARKALAIATAQGACLIGMAHAVTVGA